MKLQSPPRPDRDAVFRTQFAIGVETMMDLLAARAGSANPMIPAILGKLRPLIDQRYEPPANPGGNRKAIADRLFAAGSRAVLDVVLEQTGITDPPTIARLQQFGANVAKVVRR